MTYDFTSPSKIGCATKDCTLTKAKIQEVEKKEQYNLCKTLGQDMHLFKTKRNVPQILTTFF